MKFIIVLLVVALYGCAEIQPRQFIGPASGKAFAVGCNDMIDCYEKIGAACSSKYNIVAITSDNATFRHGTDIEFLFYHTIAVECLP